MLINDILDLSKIESGTVVVDASDLRLDDLQGYVERTFRHVAESKNLGVPDAIRSAACRGRIYTDAKRLQQIIKNLLSNAFKFTHQGQVTLTVEPVTSGWSPDNDELNRADRGDLLRGVGHGHRHPARQAADHLRGVPAGGREHEPQVRRHRSGSGDQPRTVAAAGRRDSARIDTRPGQHVPSLLADHLHSPAAVAASDCRMCRSSRPWRPELSARHGISAMPDPSPHAVAEPAMEPEETGPSGNEYGDDRDDIRAGDRVLLDRRERRHVCPFPARCGREKGFKGLITSLGAAALAMAREYNPDVLSLDIHLPDIDGWRVLERLKKDPDTRHIPVCVVSTDDARNRALDSGCLAFLAKPIPSQAKLDGLLEYLQSLSRPLVAPFVGDRTRRSSSGAD